MNAKVLGALTYNAAGGPLTQSLNPDSNAVVQTFAYNNRLQLTGIQATRTGTAIMDFSYNYVTSGNTSRVVARTDAIQAEHSANYTYDSIYRLKQATSPDSSWDIVWTFDVWGNRLSQTPTGLAAGRVTNPSNLTYSGNQQTGVQNMTYDSAGNLTNEGTGGHFYAYNAKNQMTSMDGGTANYGYDGEGRRMKKTFNAETTYTFYGPGGILCEFTTANTGAATASASDRSIYRTSERTGTAILLINSSGTVVENNRTFPYGELWQSEVASANDKKFTTYDRDKESGLDYAMNRMSSSAIGRFLSVDKGEFDPRVPESLNRYTSSLNDPINYVDPTGNQLAFIILVPVPKQTCQRTGLTVTCFVYFVFDARLIFSPQKKDCTKDFLHSHVEFVQKNYTSTVWLGNEAGLPHSWIMAWAAEESDFHNGSIAKRNNNDFSWTGGGNVRCGPLASKAFGCFSNFLEAGRTALTSKENFFAYLGCNTEGGTPGHGCVTAGAILWHQLQHGASIAEAFDALQKAGYAEDQKYGEKVAAKHQEVLAIEGCLRSQGKV